MKESDLYNPVKRYFTDLGYEVKSEVDGCDLVAVNEEQTIIVELKKTFNIPLLIQAAKRKSLSSFVYVAVPYTPRNKKKHSFTWNEAILLCRHLQIGLMTIQFFKRREPRIEIRCDPPQGEIGSIKMTRRQKRLAQEFHERSGDYQLGGIHGKKIVTAYREKSLKCAYFLRDGQPKSLADIRETFADERIVRLLQNNYYGWFAREKRGVYKITPTGKQALLEYDAIIRTMLKTKD